MKGGHKLLKQVSIFAENKKGTFKSITEVLYKNNINILGSATIDGVDFGTVRMIVSDTEKALQALEEAGFLCRATNIIGVELEDKTGSLNYLLQELTCGNINVDYTYLCFNRETGMPIIILHTDDIYEVENHLKSKGFAVQ